MSELHYCRLLCSKTDGQRVVELYSAMKSSEDLTSLSWPHALHMMQVQPGQKQLMSLCVLLHTKEGMVRCSGLSEPSEQVHAQDRREQHGISHFLRWCDLDSATLTACNQAAEVEVKGHGSDASIAMCPGPSRAKRP